MANYSLRCHPAAPAAAVSTVRVAVTRDSGRLRIRYELAAAPGAIAFAAPALPRRTDDLWRTTCMELFLGAGDGTYAEFNFAPSGAWAAWRFSGYRSGRADLAVEPPAIRSTASDVGFALDVALALPGGFAHAGAAMGLSAVVEESDGTMSWWALRHPEGDRPDFHHGDCFQALLPPPGAA